MENSDDKKKDETRVLACMERGPGPAYALKSVLGTKEHCPTKRQAPAYTIGRRYKEKVLVTPGPGYAYDPVMTTHGKIHSPSVTLAGRHDSKAKDTTPGPSDYDVHATAASDYHKAPAATMTHRPKWTPQSNAPSPNAYEVTTGFGTKSATGRKNAPAWSIRGRSDVGGAVSTKAGPGPASYEPVKPDVYMKTQARCVIQGRHESKHEISSVNDNPGPSAYNAYMPTIGKGGLSMGIRHSQFTVPYISDVDVI